MNRIGYNKMDNQRKSERVSCLVPVDAKQNDPFDKTRTIDFSKGGIGLISNNEIKVNQAITIELDLEQGEDPVFVVGKVQWVSPIADTDQYRVGLAFDSVSSGSKSRLTKYFEAREFSE